MKIEVPGDSTPFCEERRIAALRAYQILDTEPEAAFDDLTRLASHICNAPIALVSLVDRDRQWFKSKVGIEVDSTPLDVSFCVRAIRTPGLFVVPDATKDARFADNPLVTGAPYIRFYAGAPLVTEDGDAVGTLCVIDSVPRALRPDQVEALNVLARQVVTQMQLRRSERETRENERTARATVNSLTSRIAIIDEAGSILSVNSMWARTAQGRGMTSPGNGVGTNYLAVCDRATGSDAEVASAVATGIRSILAGDKHEFSLEYPCHSPTEEHWFQLRATPFDGEGPTRVVVAHEEITASKVAERLAGEQRGLRDAVAGMEQVLGVVGHELRTPLAALRAISEYLTTDGARDTPEADKFLNDISSEVDRMSDTVNNLLEAARLNSGHARWNWGVFDLNDVIDDALASIRPLIDERRVSLDREFPPVTPPMLGDADAVRRLVINLLSNARKYTVRGGIVVGVTLRTGGDDGAWADIRVSDTGCGIPRHVVARLGEAFALNSGVVGNNHVSGTGLGIAISKGIANAHGGELVFHSVEGAGTTVTARLRIDLPAAASGETSHETHFEYAL